jgi:hypothetical protein
MARETVGYRRLYDAMGCSLAEGDELRLQLSMSAITAEAYVGPKPRFGISLASGEEFIIPGAQATLMKSEHHDDPGKSSYPRRFFTEVCCSLEVETPDEVSAAFHQKDQKAQNAILAMADGRTKDLKNTADFVAGVIGLRIHRQFVVKLVCENLYALREDAPVIQFTGPWAEMLEGIALNNVGKQILTQLLEACAAADPALQAAAGSVFHWLLRAWTERDPISRFLALFVPLEMILEGFSRPAPPEWETLRKLAATHGGDQAPGLLDFIDKRKAFDRPSLNERFEAMARESGHQGWESDVAAFRKFNRLRNDLMHRGDPSVSFRITVGQDEVREMGDLIERYVSLKFFGDMQVYTSRFRASQQASPGA